jgi:two-component system response regulator AtoC
MERQVAVLIVEGEERRRSALRDALGNRGYRVCTAASADEALRLLEAGATFDAVLGRREADEAREVLRRYRAAGGRVPAILVDDEAGDPASLGGPNEVVLRPPEVGGELATAVDRAVEAFRQREAEARRAEARAGEVQARGGEGGEAVCVSAAMRRVFAMVDRIADADVPVLVRGESGVGKEVVARAIHARSGRRDGPFVKINCAALPSELLESELFGHEKGAFTGAHQEKPGKFELAHGGTIFLDELGEMHPSLQAKLLQVLQDEEFYRVGGKRPIRVDARVVVATNRELEREIERGGFREDLYYRLNVVGIRVPSLRERRDDIPPLVEHFCRKYGKRYATGTPAVRPEVMQRFLAHDWPGNVRELENMVRRLVVLGDEQQVLEELGVRSGAREPAPRPPSPPAEEEGLKEIARRAATAAEREAIDRTLKLTGWNKRKAAQRLKISYKALLYKIKECGITDPRLAHLDEGS